MMGLEILQTLSTIVLSLIIIAVLWELVWKGIALWFAARDKSKVWFVLLLLFNTLGILPIIYLLIRKKKGVKR